MNWKGEHWSAQAPQSSGVVALRHLLFAEETTIRCHPIHDEPERNIYTSCQRVLLDSARQQDEGRIVRNPTPTLKGDADVDPSPPGLPSDRHGHDDGFDALWNQGIEALLERRHTDARRAFEQARRIRPDDARCLANLERLTAMGHADVES